MAILVGGFKNGVAHMISTDSVDELHLAAHRIGMKYEWFNSKHNGHTFPHYGITTERMRAKALRICATSASTSELLKGVGKCEQQGKYDSEWRD